MHQSHSMFTPEREPEPYLSDDQRCIDTSTKDLHIEEATNTQQTSYETYYHTKNDTRISKSSSELCGVSSSSTELTYYINRAYNS